MTLQSFAFNLLTEPSANTTSAVPNGFNVYMAWLLGQCCNVTYQDYNQDTPPNLQALTLGPGITIPSTLVQGFTASEANGPSSTVSDPGDYSTFPAGFAAVISVSSPPTGVPSSFIVVALRGTQTWQEWVMDAESYPTIFAGGNNSFPTTALAHDGFYNLYTAGSLGKTVSSPLDPSASSRASGAIAQQVAAYLSNPQLPSGLPVYVTGHSLGGALAAYCAWDIAAILGPSAGNASHYSLAAMYSLAAPRCVMGFSVTVFGAPAGVPVDAFLQGYQGAVSKTFRVVHTCDIAPLVPPSTIISNNYLQLATAHVTDSWSYAGQSGGLTANVVAFAAQTGNIGNNHSCAFIYVPFLAALAGGFVGA